MVYCSKCGTQNPDTSVNCSNCGASLLGANPQDWQYARHQHRHYDREYSKRSGGIGLLIAGISCAYFRFIPFVRRLGFILSILLANIIGCFRHLATYTWINVESTPLQVTANFAGHQIALQLFYLYAFLDYCLIEHKKSYIT